METIEKLECLEGPDGCDGPVEMRWPGYGQGTWPRCERHGDLRVEREQVNIDRYMPDGPCPPANFDALDAGEAW